MKYSTKEEAQAAAMKRRNEWNKRNYRKLTVDIPIELAERLEEAASSAGESKRNIVILALEKHLRQGIRVHVFHRRALPAREIRLF